MIDYSNVKMVYYNGSYSYNQIYQGSELKWEYVPDYLCFTANAVSQIGTKTTGTLSRTPNIEYSRDKQTWHSLITDTISLSEGDVVYVRGINPTLSESKDNYFSFTITGDVTVSGDLSNLFDYRYYSPVEVEWYYRGLFEGCSGLKTVNLRLYGDAAHKYHSMFRSSGVSSIVDDDMFHLVGYIKPNNPSIGYDEFDSMFRECQSLTTAPKIYAGTFRKKGEKSGASSNNVTQQYANMFYNSRNLVDVSKIEILNSFTGGDNSFTAMFRYTGITTAPKMIFTETLAIQDPQTSIIRYPKSLCSYMFANCTKLTDISHISFLNSEMGGVGEGQFAYMFYMCSNLTSASFSDLDTFLPYTSIDPYAYQSMFAHCTNLDDSPTIYVTTATEGCFYEMFNTCTSLTHIRTYCQDFSAILCTSGWVLNITTEGDFYKLEDVTLESGEDGIPSSWTVHNINE